MTQAVLIPDAEIFFVVKGFHNCPNKINYMTHNRLAFLASTEEEAIKKCNLLHPDFAVSSVEIGDAPW